MTPLSDSEAATVQRFEAAEPAPESWGGGLRETIARALHHDWHPIEEWDALPDSVRGYYRRLADVTLALPELAALRAKAAAADRVRELAEELDAEAVARGIRLDRCIPPGDAIRQALDGPPPC